MHARLSAPSAARPSTFASTLTSSHQASSGAVGIGVLGVGAEHLGWTLGLGAHLSTAMPAPVTSFLPLHFPCLVQVSLLSLLQGFASLSPARMKFGTRSSC